MRPRFVLAAAALHGAALWLVLPRPPQSAATGDRVPPVEVELVHQEADAGAPAVAAPSPPPAPGSPEPPVAGEAAVPRAAPTPPSALAAPAVNLGDGAAERAALVVTGEGIVPPRPDAAHRNLPPTYPADAARRGRQGTVGLLVQVTELGLPGEVRVVRGSGTPSLDRAARDAVLLWRFTPARIGGAPAAFSYPIEMHFRLGGQ